MKEQEGLDKKELTLEEVIDKKKAREGDEHTDKQVS